MTKALIAAIVIVLALDNMYSQPSVQSAGPSSCRATEAYRKEGWAVPGIDGATTQGVRAKLSNLPGVFVIKLKPSHPDAFLERIWSPEGHPGRIEIETMPIKVLDIWSFDFEGKLFAYRISYARQTLNHGVRSEIAASSNVFFYDADGTGRFSLLKEGEIGIESFLPSYVPEWVRAGAR